MGSRRHVVHQAHVNAILSRLVLRNGNCKELRSFHDTATLRLRALKATKLDGLDLFVSLKAGEKHGQRMAEVQ